MYALKASKGASSYFFYESYIKKYDEAPFQEKFLAWKYGPVIKEVYDVYKRFGGEKIGGEDIEDHNLLISKDDDFKIAVYSRFVQAPKHVKYLETLKFVVDHFSEYEASGLVNLTHKPGTPWHKVSEV